MQQRRIASEQDKLILERLESQIDSIISHFFDTKRLHNSHGIVNLISALVDNGQINARDPESYFIHTFLPKLVNNNRIYFGFARFPVVKPFNRLPTREELSNILENLYNFSRFLIKTDSADTEYAENFYKNTDLKEVVFDFNHARFGSSINIEDQRLVLNIPTKVRVAPEEIAHQIEISFRSGFDQLNIEKLDQSIQETCSNLVIGREYAVKMATNKEYTSSELFRRRIDNYADIVSIRTRIENYVRTYLFNGSQATIFYIRIKDRTPPGQY